MEYFSQKDAIIDFLKDQQRRGAIIPDETFKQIERDYGYDERQDKLGISGKTI